MSFQTPIFSSTLQIIAIYSFIIIRQKRGNMADSTGETVRHELDTFVRKKRGPGDHSPACAPVCRYTVRQSRPVH